jgi:glucokinase
MTRAIGVDVGGTAIKAVLVGPAGDLVCERSVPTPSPDPTGRLTAEAIATCVSDLAGGEHLAVGITSPGLVDEARGIVIDSVNLHWHAVPIRALVEDRLGIPVGFGHDVRAGGLAEIRALPDRRPDGVTVFVPVGTGLAAAIFLGDRVLSGQGWAGEIGQIVFPSGPHAGKRLEEVASASVLARRVGTPGAADVARLVAAGDPKAVEIWDDTAAALAFALAALVATLAPDVVILGGGLAESGDLLFTPTRTWLERLLPGVPLPPFRPATHGHLAGALGAAMLGRARLAASHG